MIKLLLTAAGAAIATVGLSYAATIYSSGAMCVINANHSVGTVGENTQVWNREEGAINLYNINLAASCPTSWPSSASDGQGNAQVSVGAATLVYTDKSSGAFQCYVTIQDWNGNVTTSSSLYSCPTLGGCSTNSNPSWQGSGQLNWSRPFDWTGITFYPTGITITCLMPGSGSIIRGYNVTTSVSP